MPHKSAGSLVEERVTQLAAISERRNVLLRQMYQMMLRRQLVGLALFEEDEDEDEEGLHSFLQRFNLRIDDPEAGSISNLSENEPFTLPLLQEDFASPSKYLPPSHGKSQISQRATRTRFRATQLYNSPPSTSTGFPQPGPPNKSLPLTLEDVKYETPLVRALIENRTTHSTLQQADDLDDEHDELDLLRHPDDSVKNSFSQLPESEPSDVLIMNGEGVPISGDGQIEGSSVFAPSLEDKMFIEDQNSNSNQMDMHTKVEQVEPQHSDHSEDSMITTMPVRDDTVVSPSTLLRNKEDLAGESDLTEANNTLLSASAIYEDQEDQIPEHQQRDISMTNYQQQARVSPTYSPGLISPGSPISVSPTSILSAHRRRPVIIFTSNPAISPETTFNFDTALSPVSVLPTSTFANQPRHQLNSNYSLPPLKILPPEYSRKVKSTKIQRKREKEREKNESKKGDSVRDDWVTLGLGRWAAIIAANPVWKRVSRASKCLSTRDWAIALLELRLIRALDRVEGLKREGRWSFRQPKKQRGVGGLIKTHWDRLLDEMKWMRIDFREERKWKIALAFNLSTAVLEWHAVKTWRERVEKGICVQWKQTIDEPGDVVMNKNVDGEHNQLANMEIGELQPFEELPKISLLGVDYGSDADEDENEAERHNISDPLEPTTLIEDALNNVILHGTESVILQPKMEDIDDTSILGLENGNELLGSPKGIATRAGEQVGIISGLKTTSSDPVLGSGPTPTSSNDEIEPTLVLAKSSSSKIKMLAPLREHIAYSEDNKFFLDFHDLDATKLGPLEDTLADDGDLRYPDLTAIFPDLQPLGLLEVHPIVSPNVTDGKKRSERKSDRDDPNKRPEDTMYTRLFPVGEFMFSKPTLLGPLHPSKNWRNEQWTAFEDSVGISEVDNPGKVPEHTLNELFDSRCSNSPTSIMTAQMQTAFLKEKDPRKRGADHLWSSSDDMSLKSFIDKYPNNWALISECFNASRLTISTDKRTPRDCLERWKDKWGLDTRQRSTETSAVAEDTPPQTSSQMTTRGVKRLASTSVSGLNPLGVANGSEPKKRRRHLLVQDTIRKAAKKRAEAAQKMLANQRKPPAIHETHTQFSKMAKHTPAELSRMKAEKEARDIQELQLARRRQDELNRQNSMLRDQANRINVPQQVLQQQLMSAAQRPNGAGIPQAQGIPQIRNQVNISQQQRIGTPSMPVGNPRLSPQQLMQVQAQQARAAQQQTLQAQAQAQPQPQSQPQSQPQNVNLNGNTTINASHSSPSYTARDTALSPAHASPPHGVAAPSTAANSPRPPSAQAHPLIQTAQVPGMASSRPSLAGYYLPLHTQGFTHEQIHTALRLQIQQRAQQQQAAIASQVSSSPP